MNDSGQSVSEGIVIHAPLEDCNRVLIDFESYSKWVADIESVTIEERDSQNRATKVTFRVGAFGRSSEYTLSYDYSSMPTRLAWTQLEGDLTKSLDGYYELHQNADGSTEVTYHLAVDLKVPMPGFVKRRAEGRIMADALEQLKQHLEQGAHKSS